MASVLFVCTANRIRSPIAEASLRRAAGPLPVSIESAGTAGRHSQEIPEAVVAAEGLGLDLSTHVPRSLSDLDVSSFDLVIGFELSHIAAAVVDAGAARHKTFTLREIVRLTEAIAPPAAGDAGTRLRSAVEAANRSRAASARFEPADAIEDPIGRGQAAADRCAHEIDLLCRRLAELVWAQT